MVACREQWIRLESPLSGGVRVLVHAGGWSRIAVIVPGWNGDIDGFAGKYVSLAGLLAAERWTVLRMGNRADDVQDAAQGGDIRHAFLERVRAVLAYAHTLAMAAEPAAPVGLIGVSAGGGAVAALAHAYPTVDRVLLIAPAIGHVPKVEESLSRFRGHVYAAIGASDEVIDPTVLSVVRTSATAAASVHTVVVPGCDHLWSGRRNGLILSKAPAWAFRGDASFPDPEGGTPLY